MNKRLLFASVGLLAMAATTSLLATAGERQRDGDQKPRPVPHRDDVHHNLSSPASDGFDHGMQEVPTEAGAGQPGDGWRYFSDPGAHRAVVISPQGEYFFSRGKGMRLVAVTQPQS